MRASVFAACVLLVSALLCAVVAAAAASAVRGAGAARVAHSVVARGVWRECGVPLRSEKLRVRFALKQSRVSELERIVERVSSPNSKEYGQYLSLEDVASLVRPAARSIAAVEAAVRAVDESAVIAWTAAHEFAAVELSAAAVEAMFGARVASFCHTRSGRRLHRLAEHQAMLPHALREHVDLVLGVQDFFDTKAERRMAKESAVRAAPSDPWPTTGPYIFKVVGGPKDAVIYFNPVCQNRQFTTAPASLCSDQGGPVISSFTFTLNAESTSVPAAQATCDVVNGKVGCYAQFWLESDYMRTSISAQSVYSDGSTSDVFTYATKYAPTGFATPMAIYETYGVPHNRRVTNSRSTQAIVSFEEQYISFDDLNGFFDAMGLPRGVPKVVGPNDPSNPGGESSLDVQYVMGIGRGAPTTVWSFPDGDYILDWALTIANTSSAPYVTSISYGDTESGYLEKAGYGLQYIVRMEQELAKMAARGLTVIAGSGDAGWSNVGEMGNDLSGPDPTCTPGRAFYPSSSQYVLSLSSTFLSKSALPVCRLSLTPVPGAESIAAPIVCDRVGEVAVSVTEGRSWTTGGGFANITMRPSWQADAVAAYLATNTQLPPTQYWNSKGRGYADISTLGWNELIMWNGVLVPIGGTSASGPVMAGLIALLNDIRFNDGQPSLGLVNPLFYSWLQSHPDAFNDVVVGTNNDGDIQPPGSQYPTYCKFGFATQPGWDPVTGLGTPNWARMAELVRRS